MVGPRRVRSSRRSRRSSTGSGGSVPTKRVHITQHVFGQGSRDRTVTMNVTRVAKEKGKPYRGWNFSYITTYLEHPTEKSLNFRHFKVVARKGKKTITSSGYFSSIETARANAKRKIDVYDKVE